MASDDLTTPDRVINALKLKPDSTSEEDRVTIARWVEAASRLIREETGRDFLRPPAVEDRTFDLYGASSIYLPELLDPSSIVYVRDAGGTEVPARDFAVGYAYGYEVRQAPQQRLKGSYLHLNFDDPFGPGFSGPYPWQHLDWAVRNFEEGRPRVAGFGERISVRAEWGYETIPSDISFQAERVVRSWYKQLEHFAETQATEEFGDPSGALPSPVLAALRPWRLRRSAVLA